MSKKSVVVITGGSSGIGRAIAQEFLLRNYRIVIVARDIERMKRVKEELLDRCPGIQPDEIDLRAMDLRDFAASAALIATIERDVGAIEILITSAGIAEPGLFLEQPIEAHVEHMQINFFGSLGVAHAAAHAMAVRGRGQIVLISSGVAFVGVYGYAAYAPSKFALRGLGETLSAELAEHGIRVSVAYPPDTDTPQYQQEQKTKPEVTKAISSGGGLFSAELVARIIVQKALAGASVITIGKPLIILRWIHSLYAPLFIKSQQSMALKFSKKRKK